jgi:hypothetical protein
LKVAGISFTNQWLEYPMFLVEIQVGTGNPNTEGDGQVVAFWIGNYAGANNAVNSYPSQNGFPPTPSGADGDTDYSPLRYDDGSAVFTSLFAAIQSWAEDYDWSTLTGQTYTSITVTEFSESLTDVTPG